MADHHACCDPGASLQLTGQADFWHPTGKGTVLIADLDDRPALRVTLAPACQQLYLTVSLSAADVWPCGPGGAFLAAASRVPGEQPSAGGLGRADGSNAARQCGDRGRCARSRTPGPHAEQAPGGRQHLQGCLTTSPAKITRYMAIYRISGT